MSPVDLGPGVEQLKDVLAGVDDSQLGQPTPCPLFSVRDVIAHVGRFAQAFTAAGRKERSDILEHPPTADAPPLAEDWRTSIPRDLDTLADVWRDDAAWEGMTRIAAMDAPAEMVGATVADEILVHGWDIARATGQQYHADPALLEAALAFLESFTTPDAPGGDDVPFGPHHPTPPPSRTLDRAIALAGRNPQWSGS